MQWRACKRRSPHEHCRLQARAGLAAQLARRLTPAQSTTLGDPIAWAERIAGLTLDPWQRDVLLSGAPRLLLNATRQSGKSTVAALKAAWTVLQGGLAVVVSPSLAPVRLPLPKACPSPRRLRRRLPGARR